MLEARVCLCRDTQETGTQQRSPVPAPSRQSPGGSTPEVLPQGLAKLSSSLQLRVYQTCLTQLDLGPYTGSLL